MPSRRIARLNEQLKREIAELVRTSVRDPRVGVVSVTGVKVAGDLGSARVYVRTLGGAEDRTDSLHALQAAAPFIRRELGQILHIRRIPELRFQEDRSLEQAKRIERILAEVLPPPEGHDTDGPDGEDPAGGVDRGGGRDDEG